MIQKEFYHYNKGSKQFAGILRKHSTFSEKIMGNEILKARKLLGYQFYGQKPIDKYIVDFFCKDLKLIVELDGETHKTKKNEDNIRQKTLESLGYSVIRFRDNDLEDIDKVKKCMENWIFNYETKYPQVLEFKHRKSRRKN